MSEFKFACPVCGQHMKCDVSQAGTVMDCPTCFQKITAPQAPSADSKFILTGTKVSEKKINVRGYDQPDAAPVKKVSGALVVGLIIGGMVLAAGAIYWVTIIHPARKAALVSTNNAAMAKTNFTVAAKPVVVAPAANDANWSLTLGTNALPDTPVAGRIQGQDFIAERCTLQNGSLMLRAGTRGPVEFAVFVNFSGAQPEALAGQTINVSTNAEKAAKVSLRWKDADGVVQKENYEAGYALRLEFGALANNHLPGKIYLCTPDTERSYLLGSFIADARKPKPKAPKK